MVEVDATSQIQSLYEAAIDGSGSAIVGTSYDTDTILGIALTTGRLYINTMPKTGSGQSISAVSVSAGTPTGVDSITTGYFVVFGAEADFLYYNKVDQSTGMVVSARALKDDNTVAIGPIANAAWIGFGFTNYSPTAPVNIVLAENVSAPAGHRFVVYNATSAVVGTDLGTIDGSFFLQNPYAGAGISLFGFGNVLFGRSTFGTEANYQTDILFANPSLTGSIQKVTNTDTISEIPAF